MSSNSPKHRWEKVADLGTGKSGQGILTVVARAGEKQKFARKQLALRRDRSANQQKSEPKSCSEAYVPCKSQTGLPKECEAARQWCMKTGTFADPKTKSVSMGLRKR
jgi:hypothetical protein